MSEVLARVTTRNMDAPRGPDVVHRIRVPRAWLESGEMVEFELPRNLACAACEGGGCDSCERAGAITLRGRAELPELISVTLPVLDIEAEPRGVVIRIPEQGGLARDPELHLPRGLLLLRVEAAAHADPGVTRVAPPGAPRFVQRVAHSLRIPKPSPTEAWLFVALSALALLVALGWLAFRHFRG